MIKNFGQIAPPPVQMLICEHRHIRLFFQVSDLLMSRMSISYLHFSCANSRYSCKTRVSLTEIFW